MELRWEDAGAEGLRAVLPAVDLLDGPDKDPFSSIFMASRHTSSQPLWQPTNAVIHSMPLLSPSYTPRMPLVLEIRGAYEGLRMGIAVVFEWILNRAGAWASKMLRHSRRQVEKRVAR